MAPVRDPGGTALGEAVRRILLDVRHRGMTASAEMCLYMAARAQLAAEVIRPALARNRVVVADRYLSSTIVYQGLAGGKEPRAVLDLAAATDCRIDPHVLIVLDVDLHEAQRRRQRAPDRVEAKDTSFHENVRAGFARLPEYFANVHVVDGGRDTEAVHEEIAGIVQNALR